MKTRVISALCAGAVLALVLWLIDTAVFPAVIFAAGAFCVFELTRAFGIKELFPFGIAVFAAFAACFFALLFGLYTMLAVTAVLFLAVCCALAVLLNNTVSIARAAVFLFINLVYAVGFCCLLVSRKLFVGGARFIALLLFFIPLCGDAFAYIVGSKLGKRQLAPNISANKTAEGAAAALIITPFFTAAVFLLYTLFPSYAASVFAGRPPLIGAVIMFFAGLVGAALGIIGDLFSSLVKRFCGIKDYGRLLPGHGGLSDRLDSVLFAAPPLVIAIKLLF